MRLFAKECLLPLRIQKYEALIRRINENHPIQPALLTEYKNWMAGYHGEKSLDFHLSMLPDTNYLIFHNIRLQLGKYFFQIDILLLSAAFALALEVKNRTGEYHFQKYLNQTILKNNGKDERIKNPVLQAKLQALKLKNWLKKHNSREIPIHYLFVNSNQRAMIRVESGHEQILRNICNSEGLLEKITQIASQNKDEKLNKKELGKVKRLILTNDTPEDPDLLEHFHLSKNDLPTGVQCPICNCLPMKYIYGTWVCPNCKCNSKTVHIQALNDYFLLIKPSITNSELRRFLHIDSPKSANNILKSMNLAYKGVFKGRIYFPKRSKVATHAPAPS
ncbi:NERD domain-containing protein [Bacillus sp. ISL-40]|uniref:nuclease-related domain-containing protein n=2 Tax=Bacillus TaxID=1386 RepID=UPI001BE6236F|nr:MULTISPECIES: nuclease-related domain-containing protein [unclassified Bacillus (in: firmicutes)]MBT2699724.1 NERD domain-containing protein [Bacillus sp. ISL-40]MBT2739523.1 NERD domain-containing protein [Bacillus sp. ISL-77]